ncbi:MAG: hypothetical protein KGM43_19805 [Planctomycetota bacterium]|nr:hypothetical protein [Planctomycetota bacterium]
MNKRFPARVRTPFRACATGQYEAAAEIDDDSEDHEDGVGRLRLDLNGAPRREDV